MQRLYRTSELFERYLMIKGTRVASLRKLYNANKRYFGKRVLDIGCAGGVLGFVSEVPGRNYTGIDVNPDMIRAARRYAKISKSSFRFILGDAATTRISGRFDTIAFVGNGMAHVNVKTFSRLLQNIQRNAHRGSLFIADYRDVVELLAKRKWKARMTERREGKSFVSITTGFDTKAGDIHKLAKFRKGRNVRFTHAIWSPFILEPLIEAYGWRLLKRKRNEQSPGWVEVYRKV